VWLERPIRDPGKCAFRRQNAVQQATVSPARDSDDSSSAVLHCSNNDLSIQCSLQLVGQPKSHTADRLQGGFLGLGLRKGNDMRPPLYAIQQPPEIVFDAIQPGGLELFG
jgi:hypothetical protein